MTAHPLDMASHTLYLWHHSHCIYDKTPPMFMTSYSVYMTSHIGYEWQYNHGIRHHTHSICVITYTWLMISHPMYVWNHTVSPAPAPAYFSVLCHRVLVSVAKAETPLIRFALEIRNPEILGSCCLFLWQGQFSSGLPEWALRHTHPCTLTLTFNKDWGLGSEEGQIWGR